MSREAGRALGEALLAHPDHELYDPATALELHHVERSLKLRLPEVYRGLLEVGGGGVLASGDLLLGTKDPEGLGATLIEVTRALRDEGLAPRLLPVVDGERFLCLDGEEVVEVSPDDFSELARHGPFEAFARATWLGAP